MRGLCAKSASRCQPAIQFVQLVQCVPSCNSTTSLTRYPDPTRLRLCRYPTATIGLSLSLGIYASLQRAPRTESGTLCIVMLFIAILPLNRDCLLLIALIRQACNDHKSQPLPCLQHMPHLFIYATHASHMPCQSQYLFEYRHTYNQILPHLQPNLATPLT